MARDTALPTATPTTDTGCLEKAPSGRSVKPIADLPHPGRHDQPLGGEIEERSRRPTVRAMTAASSAGAEGLARRVVRTGSPVRLRCGDRPVLWLEQFRPSRNQ